LAVTVSQDSVE